MSDEGYIVPPLSDRVPPFGDITCFPWKACNHNLLQTFVRCIDSICGQRVRTELKISQVAYSATATASYNNVSYEQLVGDLPHLHSTCEPIHSVARRL